MSDGWSIQAYVQGFDFELVLFKQAINIFERTKIGEKIYEGVVEHSHKNTTK